VTHQLGDIVPEIERVVLMREGCIVADGGRDVLLTESSLGELFRVPVSLAERDGFVHAW
jgi:iron complex transport system ATP-binding protein